jgi:hypothetical protein
MALMREEAVDKAKFRSILEDEAEGAPDDEGLFEAAEVADDGFSVSIPGLDPRLQPVGVVGQKRAEAS